MVLTCFNHLEKYEFVNGKDDIPYITKNIFFVPNHQAVLVKSYFLPGITINQTSVGPSPKRYRRRSTCRIWPAPTSQFYSWRSQLLFMYHQKDAKIKHVTYPKNADSPRSIHLGLLFKQWGRDPKYVIGDTLRLDCIKCWVQLAYPLVN